MTSEDTAVAADTALDAVRLLVLAEPPAQIPTRPRPDVPYVLRPQYRVAGTGPLAAVRAPVRPQDPLRELVADLVRSELRSELGEVISRNMRTLVRAEVDRALADRDLL
ncbi:MAG: hypothetical protein OIF47_06795 [Marinibacterium sp.]|nr:hypothetical protein [Marinibacterium sp.]